MRLRQGDKAQHHLPGCRGHFGGLVGGALASYLLGPQLERMRDRRGKETLCDNPLIPVFASKL